MHHAYLSLNNLSNFGALFLDLSKAFDCVNHTLLLQKLWCYGFRGVSQSLLSSYLNNREQFVTINDFESEKYPIVRGVPQGSVLGPLLFILYINDLKNCLVDSTAVIYADDTVFFSNHLDVDALCNKLSRDLENVIGWLNLNYLTLNLNKTKFVIFTYQNLPINLSLTVFNETIYRSESVNFLGVLLDYKLTFSIHIKSILSKVSRIQGLFYRLSEFLPKFLLLKLNYFIF